MRQDAIIQTDDEDRAKLESLGGMEREQGGDIALRDRILIGDQSYVLKKFVERARRVLNGQSS